MSLQNTPLSLGAELVPSGEDLVIAQIQALMLATYKKDFPPGTKALRDAHPRSHGCVSAKFVVEENLPPQLRVGVFATPGKIYDAWIRYSDGSPQRRRFDVRGIGIKLLGVAGEKVLEDERFAQTQDFNLANSKAFFVKDAADYLPFLSSLPKFVFPSWNPLRWRLREALLLAGALFKNVPSPTEIAYYSQTPYAFGNLAAKYAVKPVYVPQVRVSRQIPNNLRRALALQLQTDNLSGVVLEFMVQLQTDAVKMPVEDPRVTWSEMDSPFVRVAMIYIPPQDFDNPARDEFGENLSITPWHSLPEHRPLGGINRVRKVVYRMISQMRHRANGVPRQEPQSPAQK